MGFFKWLAGILSAKGRLYIFLSGIGISVLLGMLHVSTPSFLKHLNVKFHDLLMVKYHDSTLTDKVAIVDLDEKSLQEYGQWPWPRYRVALLMGKLQKLGAAAVGIDIVFAEQDRTSPKNIKQDIKKELGLDIDFTGLPDDLQDYDAVFSTILSKGKVVLGIVFAFGEMSRVHEMVSQESCRIHPVTVPTLSSDGVDTSFFHFIQANDVVCNIPELANSTKYSGFFNTIPDQDGTIRSTPILFKYQDQYYPSLALAVLLATKGTDQVILNFTQSEVFLKIKGFPDTNVPLEWDSRYRINYKGPQRTFEYISAADILNNTVEQSKIKDKIIFIGTSAAGLKDLRISPLDTSIPGVEIHATIVDNILAQDFLRRPDWAVGIELVLTVLLGILFAILVTWSRAIWILFPFALCIGGLWYGTIWFYTEKGLVFYPVIPFIAIVVNFGALTLLKFWREESEKKFFHQAFAKYVAPSVVNQVVKAPNKLSLTGEDKEVSIMFSDIRNFTGMSELLSPNQVSELLRAYFTPMTAEIIKTNGTLDKFIGDAIMAFWNAPVDIQKHQGRAVESALGMLHALRELNRHYKNTFNLTLRIGIGLHSGRAYVGNMGSKDLFDYTIIGDSVNLCARMEGLTKFYGLGLLVSESIKEACATDYHFQEIDKVRVKGKRKPIQIFTAFKFDHRDQYKEEFGLYEQAMIEYKNFRFKQAGAIFTQLRNDHRNLPLYRVYEKRCQHLVTNPPPENWDLVFTHRTK